MLTHKNYGFGEICAKVCDLVRLAEGWDSRSILERTKPKNTATHNKN